MKTTWRYRRSKYSDLNFSRSSFKAILLDVWPLVAQTLTCYCTIKLLLSSLTGLKRLKSNSHFSCSSNSYLKCIEMCIYRCSHFLPFTSLSTCDTLTYSHKQERCRHADKLLPLQSAAWSVCQELFGLQYPAQEHFNIQLATPTCHSLCQKHQDWTQAQTSLTDHIQNNVFCWVSP